MSKHVEDILAGEYVLGILDVEQSRRFEERLEQEPALRAQVARWEALLGRFEGGHQEAPPAEAWSRLERALDREAPVLLFHTVRVEDGGWTPIAPGIEKKFLYRDPATGTESYLFRMQPGASIEMHQHPRAEECLVLEGDLAIGDLRLKAGDYHVAAKGTMHPALRSQGGAVVFVRGAVL
jgi:quercetin dioxygenase-like cupin family protein